jgi:hypothetical protein
MSTERKILLIVLGVVAGLVLLLFSSEVIEQEVAPKPVAAWVAVETEGSNVARTGRVGLTGGTPFRLHAVVQAETFSGNTIYFTEAKHLVLDGVEIADELLQPWESSNEPRILWFTVEGYTPFLEVSSVEALASFHFQDQFRADWPRTWSIPGDLRPRGERELARGALDGIARFGTQRFHVRVEIFGPESQITPRLRIQSLSAADLPERIDSISTVVSTLPEPLAISTSVYGLTQIEPQPDSAPGVADQLNSWFEKEIAFSRLKVLRQHLQRSGVVYGDLDWVPVELGVDRFWGREGAAEGDLLRVGNRWVILLQDRGLPGELDRDDLCLDFDKGARIRIVGEVFTGDGLVEWAGLPR